MAFSVLTRINTSLHAEPTPTASLLPALLWPLMKERWKRRLLFNTIDLQIRSDLSAVLLGLFFLSVRSFYAQRYPWKCPSDAARPTASDLIYLFKEGIEESGRAVTFQSIHQCKGRFPLETRGNSSRALSAPTWSSGKSENGSCESNVLHTCSIQRLRRCRQSWL